LIERGIEHDPRSHCNVDLRSLPICDLSLVVLAQTAPAQLSIQLDKGSTGYPNKILNTSYFRHPQYFATGWKVMPSDLSSARLNLGLHKVMLGEVDVFQLAQTDGLFRFKLLFLDLVFVAEDAIQNALSFAVIEVVLPPRNDNGCDAVADEIGEPLRI
jgi:hypothetical protein